MGLLRDTNGKLVTDEVDIAGSLNESSLSFLTEETEGHSPV